MKTRTAQIILMATALVLGVTTDVFNGQSLLALVLLGAVLLIERGRNAAVTTQARN